MADKEIVQESQTAHVNLEAAVKAVEAGDNDADIAAQIIADYSEEMRDGWSADEEKKLVRRVDWRLIPGLFLCATLSDLEGHLYCRNLQRQGRPESQRQSKLMGWLCPLLQRPRIHGSLGFTASSGSH
ncbi:hypothetical protein BJX65DRAFT_309339 [Aspergillus insuetus]